MIDRVTDVALRIAVLLASLGSLLSLAKMMVEHFTPVGYYWWAAVAFFGATAALALAIRLRDEGGSARRARKGDGETPLASG